MIADYSALYAGRSTPWQSAELKEGLGPIPEALVQPVAEEVAPAAEAATAN